TEELKVMPRRPACNATCADLQVRRAGWRCFCPGSGLQTLDISGKGEGRLMHFGRIVAKVDAARLCAAPELREVGRSRGSIGSPAEGHGSSGVGRDGREIA